MPALRILCVAVVFAACDTASETSEPDTPVADIADASPPDGSDASDASIADTATDAKPDTALDALSDTPVDPPDGLTDSSDGSADDGGPGDVTTDIAPEVVVPPGASSLTWLHDEVPEWVQWIDILPNGDELYVGTKHVAALDFTTDTAWADFYAERRTAAGALVWTLDDGGLKSPHDLDAPGERYDTYRVIALPGRFNADGHYVALLAEIYAGSHEFADNWRKWRTVTVNPADGSFDIGTATIEDLDLIEPLNRRFARAGTLGSGGGFYYGNVDHTTLGIELRAVLEAADQNLYSVASTAQAVGMGPHGGPATLENDFIVLYDDVFNPISSTPVVTPTPWVNSMWIEPVGPTHVAIGRTSAWPNEAVVIYDTAGVDPDVTLSLPAGSWYDTVLRLSDGDILAVGGVACTGKDPVLYLARHKLDGTLVWERAIEGIPEVLLHAQVVRELPDGQVVIARVTSDEEYLGSTWDGITWGFDTERSRWRVDLSGAELLNGPSLGAPPCSDPCWESDDIWTFTGKVVAPARAVATDDGAKILAVTGNSSATVHDIDGQYLQNFSTGSFGCAAASDDGAIIRGAHFGGNVRTFNLATGTLSLDYYAENAVSPVAGNPSFCSLAVGPAPEHHTWYVGPGNDNGLVGILDLDGTNVAVFALGSADQPSFLVGDGAGGVVAALTVADNGPPDVSVRHYDAAGTLQWEALIDPLTHDEAAAIVRLADGRVVVSIKTPGAIADNHRLAVIDAGGLVVTELPVTSPAYGLEPYGDNSVLAGFGEEGGFEVPLDGSTATAWVTEGFVHRLKMMPDGSMLVWRQGTVERQPAPPSGLTCGDL